MATKATPKLRPPLDSPEVHKAIDKVAAARSEQAVGAECAGDYIYPNGVKLYKATAAHMWLMMRVRGVPFESTTDYAVICVASLTCDSEYVRNELLPRAGDREYIVTWAYNTVTDCEIDINLLDQVANDYLVQLLKPDKKKPEEAAG